MWRETMLNLAPADFLDAVSKHRATLLYPQIPFHNLYLSYLLQNESSSSLLYYPVKPEETTLTAMLNGLVQEFSVTVPGWGANTQRALKSGSASDLASALIEDIMAVDDEAILYLGDLDYLEVSDDYERFFSVLINRLPAGCKLVVCARELALEPWQMLVLDGIAISIGNERRMTNLMFEPQYAGMPQLEINSFGRGQAFVNGRAITSWDGVLPRNLFFYLIDRDLITRDEIFSVFWPDLDVKDATNVFHVTKRKIAERLSAHLGDDMNIEITQYAAGFYRPGNNIARHYDVHEFEYLIDEASTTFNDAKQEALYRRAISLYRVPFLLSLDLPWVVKRREKLRRKLMDALIGVARICKDGNRLEEALGYFMQAIRENPLREDIHREVMSLYLRIGRPEDAKRQYQELATITNDLLGVDPGPESQALLNEIRSA